MYDLILVRYGEMTLKKSNYKQFLQKVNANIKAKCKHLPNLHFENTMYRFYIYLNGEDHNEVIKALNTVVGLHSYSLCTKVEPNYDKIAEKAVELIKKENENLSFTFKVETNRGNKDFPATSLDISREVARRVLVHFKDVKVDVHHPKITLSIDLRSEGTYIYTKTVMGLGGYPSGIGGSGVLMMSGGIDSPVAGYLSIRKGVNLCAIHFASPPYTSDMALQKVVDLLQKLALYTLDGKITLYVVPFTKVQDEIHNKANNEYLVTIMRRCMYKIASKFCEEKNIQCIINGESIGQVASQTLESIKVVNEVTNIPIIRPLATYDKQDIIDVSFKIGTYDISIRPYEDCCTVFVPEHPVIKPDLDKVLAEEAKCTELDSLVLDAINNIERINLSAFKEYNVFNNDQDKFEI
mgnify:CR=1 FL=1